MPKYLLYLLVRNLSAYIQMSCTDLIQMWTLMSIDGKKPLASQQFFTPENSREGPSKSSGKSQPGLKKTGRFSENPVWKKFMACIWRSYHAMKFTHEVAVALSFPLGPSGHPSITCKNNPPVKTLMVIYHPSSQANRGTGDYLQTR